jgi:pimeloyl-ACP methyl ester carboxylesterase
MAESAATVVLVHGAWTDGSSWNKVIALLLASGTRVIAVQIPLTSLADDAAATSRIIQDTEGPIVLVGHSWGGMAVTQAGNDPKVAALVYVAAFAPDVGESGSSLIGAHPPAPPALSTMVTDSAGFVYQTAEGFVQNIAPDMAPAEARIAAVTQGRLAGSAFGETVTQVAWKTRPSWFVVSSEDRVVSSALQEAEAKRMNARKIVLKAGHMSLLSHASEVAAVIGQALTAVAASKAN